jgi:hydrophobic/amphiphilic exporter-1 (mainly G- bacteria), HAE1 family
VVFTYLFLVALYESWTLPLSVIPLVIATGAGAGARTSIGTTVFGGMLLASFIGVLFIPALFAGFEFLTAHTSRMKRRGRRRPEE